MARSDRPAAGSVRRRVSSGILMLAGSLAWGVGLAAEYRSVGGEPAVLYDAPTLRGGKTAIAPRGMPVEIVVTQGDWLRVRDSAGALSWVEKRLLVDKRTLIATDPGPVEVHANADDGSPVTFRVQPGVLLELASPPAAGWVGVRHRDGQSGFVRVGSVWGE